MSKKENQEEKQTYIALGATFLGTSVVFLLNDTLRAIGIVFAILGATFFIIGFGRNKK